MTFNEINIYRINGRTLDYDSRLVMGLRDLPVGHEKRAVQGTLIGPSGKSVGGDDAVSDRSAALFTSI